LLWISNWGWESASQTLMLLALSLSTRKHTGSLRKLGQMKRQSSKIKEGAGSETSSSYEVG